MKTDADFFISSPQAIRYAYLSAQGRCFKLRLPFLTPTNRSIVSVRGVVGEFSRASRKRMLEMVARLDLDRVSHITFISVTYPDRDGPPTAKNSSRDLDVFWKRLKRKIPNASGIWRREWEDRKSGECTPPIS